MKNSKTSNRKYFNFIRQEKDNTVCGVCFSPTKHSELNTFGKTKSPIKVSNDTRIGGKDIINQFSNVAPLDSGNVDFVYSDKLTSNGMVNNIVSCSELASEQMDTLKAEVAQVSGVKKVHTQYQGTLMKQEVILRDTSSFIKAVLWDSHIDTLKEKDTYIFKNFKVKIYKGDRYLNTPKNEQFEAKRTTGFDQPLVDVHESLDAASATIIGNVVGVVEVAKMHSCVNCKKNVAPLPGDYILAKCDG